MCPEIKTRIDHNLPDQISKKLFFYFREFNMEVIKRKITSLKDELEIKEDEVVTLRAQLDKANIETEKAENEAASQNRRVCDIIT